MSKLPISALRLCFFGGRRFLVRHQRRHLLYGHDDVEDSGLEPGPDEVLLDAISDGKRFVEAARLLRIDSAVPTDPELARVIDLHSDLFPLEV